MSGLAGIFHRDGRPVDRSALTRMTDRLAHRGPDGLGHWTSSSVGLGSTFFWTTPEAVGEKQPIHDESRRFTLVFDGRIDNRGELQSTLKSRGFRGGVRSDAEIVLAAYAVWEEGCAERLLGDFAFAVWDDVRKRMYCARDHFGTKPFCFHLSDRLFVFGTEVKAVLAVDGVPAAVDEGRILDYLARVVEGPDKTSTFFPAVKKLPPAHWMTVSAGGIETRRYWALDPSNQTRFASDGEYADAFREIFAEAVRCRLRGAEPVASMLSGGLDSGAIVGFSRTILSESGRPDIKSFSAVNREDPSCQETAGVDSIVGLGQIESSEVSPEDTDVYVYHHARILLTTDNPWDESILNAVMAVYAKASAVGVRVLLDGIDGDRIASQGWEVVPFLVLSGRPSTAVRVARVLRSFYGGYPPGNVGLYYWSLARRLLPQSLLPSERERRARIRAESTRREGLIASEYAERYGLRDRLAAYARISASRQNSPEAIHALQIDHPHLTAAIERYDRVAAAFCIERRSPFVDKRLIEFCIGLPLDQKLRNHWTKWILRSATDGILPESVRWARRLRHLGPAFTKRVAANRLDGLDFSSWPVGTLGDRLDAPATARALERYQKSPDSRDRERLLVLRSLETWLDS